MRFTLKGQSYELTPDQVRLRLAGHVPEAVRQYWVDIDGIRWPVKQVLRLAIGSSDFQSLTARSVLGRLGFPLGGEESKASPTRSRSAPPDLRQLEVTGTVEVQVSFAWRRVGAVVLDDAGLPKFPAVPAVPGLYRFDFGPDASGEDVGLSGSLCERDPPLISVDA